jgi:hypothetical protein
MSVGNDAANNNGQGSTSSGQGSEGQNREANAQSGSQGQGSQSASNNGNGQGSDSVDISKHPAFVALSQKLEGVISDNAKYRQRIRSLAGDDESGNGQGNGSGNDAANEILQEIRSERALNRLSAAADKAGFRTPDLILNFVNLSEVMDEKGNVSNPQTVIDNLKSKYPEMFRPIQEGSGDGGAGNRNRNGNGSADMNSIIRSRIRGTTR